MKVIPAVDIMDGSVVRLLRGDPRQKTTYSDDPVATALKWQKSGADIIHIVDLDSALGQGSNADIIRDIAGALDIPFQVAGGLRNMESVSAVLEYASRAVIGTLAFENEDATRDLLARYGAKRLVISADHRSGKITTRGWQRETQTGLLESVQGFASAGFTEFLITEVGRDGTLLGPDLDYLGRACSIGGINVISSGGISSVSDVEDVRRRGAAGVILGRALYDGKITVEGAVGTCR